jgi:GntR family transcriptional repressor for pyruvate dehydrogenase complex
MAEQFGFRTVQSNKIGKQISYQLLQKITSGEFPPGTRLPAERNLAEIFSASRVAVREALGSLVTQGILTVKQGSGTTVNPLEEWNTLDPQVIRMLEGDRIFIQLSEFRKIIEPSLAEQAAARITDKQILYLKDLSELPASDTSDQHAVRDNNFHLEIARITGNTVSLIVMSSIADLLHDSRKKALMVEGEIDKAREWHHRIYEAIAARDPAAARQAMEGHLQQVTSALNQYIEESE